MNMKIDNVEVSLDAIELSAEPPKEIVLFKEGWTDTKKGRFLFDEEAADLTMESIAKDGRDRLPFDIGHGMLSGTDADRHKAAGWFKPEVRNGALVAADIEWTPKTFEALSNREYRFHSPALTYDKNSRRVTGLINVALTNIPATNNQTPLVLDSNTSNGGEAPQQPKDNMKLVALLGVTEDKIEQAVEALHAEHEALKAEHAPLKEEHAALLSAKADVEAKLEEAEAKLTGIEVAKAKSEREAAIAKLSAEGKLAPAQHDFATKLSAEQFEEFVATLSGDVVNTDKQDRGAEGGSVESLSDVEKGVIEQLQISPEAFLAQKASK